MKLWKIAELDKNQATIIQNKYNLPSVLAMLLQIRGICSSKEIEDFLFNTDDISSPFEIKDMEKAADRIKKALDDNELICVYGDYDADGVTSTALLYSYLEAICANVMYYIPSREEEGYGMNNSAIDFLNEKGVKLIVTVDNGIAACKEIEYASSLGIETVVTDHHLPQGDIPNAVAVVDLHQADCNSSFKSLSGVGVAFKLIMALEGEYCDTDALLDNYADILAIGTIGDIVELKGENRVFVKRGLQSIANTERQGLRALIEASGLGGKVINSGNISFGIVPRINAVGRLGSSGKSVELLLTEDYEEAKEIAEGLIENNYSRQQIEKEILESIDIKIKNDPSLIQNPIIVIDGENWHQGVIGIVASRVKEAFGKPTIIITKNSDGAKASGRSVEGFSLSDAVFACSDLLKQFGGHPMAVGLSLEASKIALFRKKINEYAASFSEMPFDTVKIDFKINPTYISAELVQDLSYLQPYGAGNPTPVFGLYNMTVDNIIPLSNNKHLKLILKKGNSTTTALKFFTSTDSFPYKKGDLIDLAVNLEINEYNGNKSASVIVKALKSSSDNMEQILSENRLYERFLLNYSISSHQKEQLCPKRDDFALLYRYLKNCHQYTFPIYTLVSKLDNNLSFGKIRVMLNAMQELGLIDVYEGLYDSKITVLPVHKKVSLEDASIIKRLRGVM